MINFNGEEEKYDCRYLKTDNIVIQIQTADDHPVSLMEILKKVNANAPLPEGVSLKTYLPAGSSSSGPKSEFFPAHPEYATPWDDKLLDNEEIAAMDDDFYVQSQLSKAFDRYSSHPDAHKDDFTETPIPPNIVHEQISAALGILPTVMDHTDLTVEEQIRMSKAGNDLFWHFNDVEGHITKNNQYPDVDTIRFYEKCNPYEKRVIKNPYIHPRKTLQVKKLLDQARPGMLLTNQAVEFLKKDRGRHTPEECADLLLNTKKIEQIAPAIAKASELFQQKFHRAPRVVDEYVLAHILAYNGGQWDDAFLQKVVDDFSLSSLQKVSRTHNLTLYAMSSSLNFNEVTDEHIQAFGVFMRPENLETYRNRGFFEWYNAHKNLNTSDLMEIMENIDRISHFSPEQTVMDLLYQITQENGKNDCRKMENKYHYSFANNDLAIRGRNIQVTDGKYTIFMLPADDYRNFTVGTDTHCCQVYGNAGESCVYHLTSQPYSGVTVIVANKNMRDGKWISGTCAAQAFTWTDESKDTIVFDNMEFANDRSVSGFADLIAQWAYEMPYKNMHVGTGYNQGMIGWGKQVNQQTVSMPESGRHIYSDYHSNARALKINGGMQIQCKHPDRLRRHETTLIPSAFEFLNRPELSWLASANMSLPAKRDLANRFLENPTEAVQFEAIRISPAAIKCIEHPTEAVQHAIADQHPEYIKYIQNPCESLYNTLVAQDPYQILTITNPSEQAWQLAVERNGLLLEHCPYNSETIWEKAVSNNGIAIKFIPNPDETLQRKAVENTPLALNFIQDPTTEVTLYALHRDVTLLQNMESVPLTIQTQIVADDPSNILYIKHPDMSVVYAAIQQNGNLIRNFHTMDEQLQLAAVQQNGLSIRYIKNPTTEIVMAAVRQNQNAIRFVRLSPQEKQSIMAQIREEQTAQEEYTR